MTDTAVAQLPQRLGRAVPVGLLDLRLSPTAGRTALASPDAVTQGLATAKVFAFASADYPGAALSMLFDSNSTTAVGAFEFDSTIGPPTAFTFTAGAYQILPVPGSTASFATSINSAGLIVGTYEALAPALRGFVKNGSTFSDVDFPAPPLPRPWASTMPGRSSVPTSTLRSSSRASSAAAASSRPSTSPGPPGQRPPVSTPPGISWARGRIA